MEYINFNVALPYSAYLDLEHAAKKFNTTKNQIITHAIFRFKSSNDAYYMPQKNAGFDNDYNKF